jgi:zinc-ribbon domain
VYCPRCGQQQASEGVRFCPRCGFLLRAVAELLAYDGDLPGRPAREGEARLTPRQKGVRLGSLLMLTSLLVAVIQALMPTLVDRLVVLAAPVIICFFAGFVRLLYALFFEEGAAGAQARREAARGSARLGQDDGAAAALPPPRSVPVSDWRRPEAATSGRPPSVTEGTTRLIERDSGAL